jgi:cation:H+ antiporter
VAKAILLGPLFLFAAEAAIRPTGPQTILWAAPSILIAALVIAWAAESAQFFIAQGFALAILAWMQTLPEFAVEAVLAWHQQVPYLLANLTGAVRLLTGLGWPMIYFAAASVHRRRTGTPLRRIVLEGEHSVQVVGLIPALAYVSLISWKRSLDWTDALVLAGIYAAYLALLSKMPPEEEEGIEELERVPRAIVLAPRARRIALISALFIIGGALIYAAAEPFLASLFAISLDFGIPAFVFIQWVAPFLSEFPEGLSTFYWARSVHRAPMALMNLVSSNINQWTLLMAMLPVVLSMGAGHTASIPLDSEQELELLMTIGQQLLGLAFLLRMELTWSQAGMLFVLWFVQFFFSTVPAATPVLGALAEHVHPWVTAAYFVWSAVELLRLLAGRKNPAAFVEFAKMWRAHVAGGTVR